MYGCIILYSGGVLFSFFFIFGSRYGLQCQQDRAASRNRRRPCDRRECIPPTSATCGSVCVGAVARGPAAAGAGPRAAPPRSAHGKGLWRGVGEPLFSPCQKGINEFVNGSHVAELIQHQKVIDYTATIQWLPHSISTFFGLLRAFHAATLHHTAKRRLDHIQQPTVRARTHTQRIRSLYRP